MSIRCLPFLQNIKGVNVKIKRDLLELVQDLREENLDHIVDVDSFFKAMGRIAQDEDYNRHMDEQYWTDKEHDEYYDNTYVKLYGLFSDLINKAKMIEEREPCGVIWEMEENFEKKILDKFKKGIS
tara:strand:+ start:44 stop:421 length:378 start_codon:yes stop_codon:yes gene_type:complete